ncbi:MAG: hypothetical protein N2689_18350, partial [Verrucomicrobiae bacterium]|nr:hypothetical protein [Verrucomicrobiae bacterium]
LALYRDQPKKQRAFLAEITAIDRAELNDLAASKPQRAARMKGELDAWLRSVVASLNGSDYKAQ